MTTSLEEDVSSVWGVFAGLTAGFKTSNDASQAWLDAFLSLVLARRRRRIRASLRPDDDEWPAAFNTAAVCTELSRIWMLELRNMCVGFESSRDGRPMRDFLLRGRGWRILAVLEELASHKENSWCSKEFVQLHITLFQLVIHPPSSENGSDSSSVANADQPEASPPPSDSTDIFSDCRLSEVVELWSQVQALYEVSSGKTSTDKCVAKIFPPRKKPWSVKVKASRATVTAAKKQDLLRLRAADRRFAYYSSGDSSDGTTSVFRRHRRGAEIHVFPSNPMDFEYFDSVIRSEDEAKFQIEWKRKRESTTFREEDREAQTKQQQMQKDPSLESRLRRITSHADHSPWLTGSVTEGQCGALILTLLIKLCSAEIRRRSLKKSYELSLSLISFASDSMLLLTVRSDAGGPELSLGVEERLQTRLLLSKLLLVALTEIQFDPGYLVVLQNNSVLHLVTQVALDCLQICESSEATNMEISNTIQLVASVTHVVQSFQHFPEKFHPRSTGSLSLEDEAVKSCYAVCDHFFSERGGSVFERTIQLTTRVRKNRAFSSDIAFFFKELSRFLTKVTICELELLGKAISRKTVKGLGAVYAVAFKSIPEFARDEVLDDDSFLLNDIVSSLSEGIPKGGACINLGMAIENLTLTVKLLTTGKRKKRLAPKDNVVANVFSLLESVFTHFCQHRPLSRDRTIRNDDAIKVPLSDSDSAFYASDASLEMTRNMIKDRSSAVSFDGLSGGSGGNLLQMRCYLDLLLLGDCPEVVTATVAHIARLIVVCSSAMQVQIFSGVIIPFLDQTVTSLTPKLPRSPIEKRGSSASISTMASQDVDLKLSVRECLILTRGLLSSKDILGLFHQQKVLKLVLSFKSVPGLTEESYALISKYLSTVIRVVLYSSADSSSSAGAGGNLASEGDSSSDEIERNLTDEDVFHPQFMTALSITSLVKEFHELLVAHTAIVLESLGQQGRLSPPMSPNSVLRELQCAWKTQAELIGQFSEYQDYAQSKGIARMIEDLHPCLLHLMGHCEFTDLRRVIVETIGFLIQILVQFNVRAGEGPATYFNGAKILDESLEKLAKVILGLDDLNESCVRSVILCLLSAAGKEPWEREEVVVSAETYTAKQSVDFSYDADESSLSENDFSTAPVAFPAYSGKCRVIQSAKVVTFVIDFVSRLISARRSYCEVAAELCMYKLYEAASRSAKNAHVLKEGGICQQLLVSYGLLMAHTGQYPSLRREVSRLITFLAQQGMARRELRLMLDILKCDPATEPSSILECLNKVAKKFGDSLEPSSWIQFPVVLAQPSSSMTSSASKTSLMSAEERLARSAKEASSSKRTSDGDTSWQHFCSEFVISQVSTSVFFGGHKNDFSISFWLSLPQQPLRGKLHVLSLGDRGLMMEVWCHASAVTVQVSSGRKNATVFGLATFPLKSASLCQWSHVVINCQLKVSGGSNSKAMEVEAIVNGIACSRLLISLKSLASLEFSNLTMLVGHRSKDSSAEDSFRLATFNIFHGQTLSEQQALFLLLLGAETSLVALSGSPVNERVRFHMRSALFWFPHHAQRIARTEWKPVSEQLQDALMISLTAQKPNRLLLYISQQDTSSSGSLSPGIFSGLLLPGSSASSSPSGSSPASFKSARGLPVKVTASALQSTAAGSHVDRFCQLINCEGGVSTLLMLVARTVELGLPDADVAKAINTLLVTVESSEEMRRDFMVVSGYKLLAQILDSERCNFELQSLKAILDNVTTKSILSYDHKRKVHTFQKCDDCIVHNPHLLELVIARWRQLDKSVDVKNKSSLDCETLADVVLKALRLLLEENQSQSTRFNISLMRRLKLPRLLVYKATEEHFFPRDSAVKERRGQLNIARQLISIISSLIGSPPDCSMLRDIVDLALLLHESQRTFVTRIKSNICLSNQGSRSSSRSSMTSTSKSERVTSAIPSTLPEDDENGGSPMDEGDDSDIQLEAAGLRGAEAIDQPMPSPASAGRVLNKKQRPNSADIGDAHTEHGEPKKGRLTIKKSIEALNGGEAVNEDVSMSAENEESMEEEVASPSNMMSCDDASTCQEYTTKIKELHGEGGKIQHSILERPGQWGTKELLDSQQHADLSEEDEDEDDEFFGLTLPDILMVGLLEMLTGSLQNLPDNSLVSVLNDVVLPEFTLVFCNHPSVSVREQSLKLIWQYTHRSRSLPNLCERLNRISYYYLLANQLHRYEATEGIVNACLSILHNKQLRMEDTLEIPSYTDTKITAQALLPLLAIMPNTVGDIALAHGLVSNIHEIFAKFPDLLKSSKALGLFESLCKTIRFLSHSESSPTDICGQDGRDIIFHDLYDFLRLIALRFVLAHDADQYRALDDLLHLLLLASLEESPVTAEPLRTAICVVLEECLSTLKANFARSSPKSGQSQSRKKPYEGFFPLEEMTGAFLRTVTRRGSSTSITTSVDDLLTSVVTQSGIDTQKIASSHDLGERFMQLVEFSVDFLVSGCVVVDGSIKQCEEEEAFSNTLLHMLMAELQQKWDRPKLKTLFSNKDKLHERLMMLLNFCLSHECPLQKRLSTLRMVHDIFVQRETLPQLLSECNERQATTFGLLVQEMVVIRKDSMSEENQAECERFHQFVQSQGYLRADPDLGSEIDRLSALSLKARADYLSECHGLSARLLDQIEELSQSVDRSAVEVTKAAMRAQDEARKDFMASVRSGLTERVRAQQQWLAVIERNTNETNVWHFADKYPRSWFLSEFEGAQRMRLRMERRHTAIDQRHYMAEFKHRGGPVPDPPFAFLVKGPSDMSGLIIEQLNSNDHIKMMEKVTFVLPDEEVKGELLLSSSALYFVETISSSTPRDMARSYTWKMEAVREIHKRWFQLTDNAVEIFFACSTARFFVFLDRRQRNHFIRRLTESYPRLNATDDIEQLMRQWQDGGITNFDYLMQLNKLAGRTFNDLMQYPAYPFILSDYTSDALDLFKESSFRDLHKPIAIQHPEKEDRFVANYTALAEELKMSHEGMCPGVGPYHYGSHYSNTGIVLHFLVRVPPYTSMFLRYQDGNFDLPDRSFHSLSNTWRLASRDSATDVKELIPDLFCLPELLMNGEGFDLGVRQNGERVGDVILPPWAKGDARLFIKIHRQALESDYVRENLNHWVDLVFGYKQTGSEAVSSVNVFHPATYYGFDVNSISDPVQRDARSAMIKTYGQTPKQLFTKPHPMVSKLWTHERKSDSTEHVPRVLDNVAGLRWGNYVGSPAHPEPKVAWREPQAGGCIARLVTVETNEVFGLPSDAAVAVHFSQDKNRVLAGAALLTFGHVDNVLRVRLKRSACSQPIRGLTSSEVITAMDVAPEGERLWIGYACGKIVAQSYTFNHKDLTFALDELDIISLYGHTSSVTCLSVCVPFGIVVSGSADGSVIVWDMNNLSFVRQIGFGGPVSSLAVSRTSGDMAVVSGIPGDAASNQLSLFTINGSKVASEHCEPAITAVAFSASPEGVSVNVVATGHKSGIVRLWSSWDLSAVRDIPSLQGSPVVALAFSWDNQNLFVATAEKEVIIFEKGKLSGLVQAPRFVNLSYV